MNILSNRTIAPPEPPRRRETPRERLLDILLSVSCALDEAAALFRADDAAGIQHLETDVRALLVSADVLIQRLAE